MSTERPTDPPMLIVFDGVCVLCNGWVRFLLARDPQARFRFAAMQSEAGRRLLASRGLDPDDPASFLLIEREEAYTDTAAIRRVLGQLGPGWRLLAGLLGALPQRPRDALYRLIARNRYRWFGRHKQCLLPSAELRERFIDLLD